VSIVEAAFEDAKARFESGSADDPQMLELTKSKTSFNEVSNKHRSNIWGLHAHFEN
jgi:hypothetical protein